MAYDRTASPTATDQTAAWWVTVEPIMGSEIKERRFGITRDGAPYPPIQSVDANLNFSQAGKSAAPSPTQFRNQWAAPSWLRVSFPPVHPNGLSAIPLGRWRLLRQKKTAPYGQRNRAGPFLLMPQETARPKLHGLTNLKGA
jgi:hypothetical protein